MRRSASSADCGLPSASSKAVIPFRNSARDLLCRVLRAVVRIVTGTVARMLSRGVVRVIFDGVTGTLLREVLRDRKDVVAGVSTHTSCRAMRRRYLRAIGRGVLDKYAHVAVRVCVRTLCSALRRV